MQLVHLNDNTTDMPCDHPNHDRIHKIRPIVDLFPRTWQEAYKPDRNIAIDEMIAFKGKTHDTIHAEQVGTKGLVLGRDQDRLCFELAIIS